MKQKEEKGQQDEDGLELNFWRITTTATMIKHREFFFTATPLPSLFRSFSVSILDRPGGIHGSRVLFNFSHSPSSWSLFTASCSS